VCGQGSLSKVRVKIRVNISVEVCIRVSKGIADNNLLSMDPIGHDQKNVT